MVRVPPLARLVLPYTRLELPGWGHLVRLAERGGRKLWDLQHGYEMRGKWHGYQMLLDLTDEFDRYTYFSGRYCDLASQLFMRRALRPGDTFVDVGANSGMLTLLAARIVGATGWIEAFEPNPVVCSRLQDHADRNGLAQVHVSPWGLGDREELLTLRVIESHTGWGTFGAVEPALAGSVTAEHQARVVRGDDVLRVVAGTPLLIKVDVEGFECRALRGLSRTIAAHRPVVMTESVPEHLARANSSLAELFGVMSSHGHRAFALKAVRHRLRYRLALQAIRAPDQIDTTDLVWLHPEGVHLGRLPEFLFADREGAMVPASRS